MAGTNIKVVICDIEGTTTSISFVKDTLFPYALEHVKSFLEENWDKDSTKEVIASFRIESKDDIEAKLEGAIPLADEEKDKNDQITSIIENVKWQMSIDRKTTPLKSLQGLIWEKGYENGDIKGHVYSDVPKAFDSWASAGIKIYIYSSGSVQAQKLLFAHTEYGNLLPKIAGHFDTKIGIKQEKNSYENIIKEIDCAANEIMFLTDIVNEAKSAKDAGMQVIILSRPGNGILTDEDKNEYKVVTSFDENLLKRKIDDTNLDEEDRPTKIAKIEHKNDDCQENKETDTKTKNDQLNTTDENTKAETKPKLNDKCLTKNTNGDSKCSDTETPMDVDDENDAKTINEVNEKTDDKSSDEKTEIISTKIIESSKNDQDIDMSDKTKCDDVPTVTPPSLSSSSTTVTSNEINKNVTENVNNTDKIVEVVEKEEDVNVDVSPSENKTLKHSNNTEDEKIQTNNDTDVESKTEQTEVNKKTENILPEFNGSDKEDTTTANNHSITSDNVSTDNVKEINISDDNKETKTIDDTEKIDVTTEKVKEQINNLENDKNCDKPNDEIKNKIETISNGNTNTNTITTTNGDNNIDNSKMDTDDNEQETVSGAKVKDDEQTVSEGKVEDDQQTISDAKVNGKCMIDGGTEDEVATKKFIHSSENDKKDSVVTMDTTNESDLTDKKTADVIKPSDIDGVSKLQAVESENNVVPNENVPNIEKTESNLDKSKDDITIDNADVAGKLDTINETKCDDIEIAVVKCESSNDNTDSSSTTQTTESRETIENNTEKNKEKISRVEITIEQTDKQLGQTTQTTTHIVKEISITEQLVCGKKEASFDLSKESANLNENSVSVTNEEASAAESKTNEKLETEKRENGNIESIIETNGNGKKEGNDSDKENDEIEQSSPLNGDSKDASNEIVVKKCSDILSETSDGSIATSAQIQSES